jgi:acetyl-CoA synthetase
MADYEAERAAFSWEKARTRFSGLPGGRGLNMAYEAVDRHAAAMRGDHVALRSIGRDGSRRDVTYGELAERSNRFANVLSRLGVEPGDRVFVLMPRTVDLFVVALGTLKHRAVLSPLFAAFGPEPIRQRLALGAGRVLVTTAALYRRRVEPIRSSLPELRHVVLSGPGEQLPPGTVDLSRALALSGADYHIGPTDPLDTALLHFTSGTTGAPKGVLHAHEAVVSHALTGCLALDLHEDDVFWCTADPGWVTGTSYGIIAPLALGATSVVDEAEFAVERWYEILEREHVNVWYTVPTALRMMARAGPQLAQVHDFSALRFVASVGEALNPELVVWTQHTLGAPAHDNWWQTETGAIMVANYASMDIRPGSMGRAVPGIEAAVLARDAGGRVVVDGTGKAVRAAPGEQGELGLRPGWPSMFRGYLGDDERYQACFSGGWYLSGDLAREDEDGYFWFVGRIDDVIESAGHLVGPFEVESCLMEHPAVAEAGVVGVPDPVAGELVEAFVTLRPGTEPSEELRLELIGFARTRLGPAVAPRQVVFDQDLPHTGSGKVVRRLLKARALGLPDEERKDLGTAS